MMADLQPSSRVEITGILFSESEEHTVHYDHLIGERGIITSTDGHLYTVLLDNFLDDPPRVFFHDELGMVVGEEGGDQKGMKMPITNKSVLMRQDASAYEKLTYFVIQEFAPACLDDIMDCCGVQLEVAMNITAKLQAKGLVASDLSNASLFWPTYTVGSSIDAQKKVKDKAKAKAEKDGKDYTQENHHVLLFIKQVEKHHKQRGTAFKISKTGTKYCRKAVQYLNKLWDKREDHRELDSILLLSDLYYSYVEYTFKHLVDNELNHLKRLTFAGNKGGWRASMKNTQNSFQPHLLKRDFTNKKYYGIPMNEIPDDPLRSGYYSTVQAFLMSKWTVGNYPLATQVLYALECFIIYKLFRKQDVVELKKMHFKYLTEYKKAATLERLDDLSEYVSKNKKKSNFCNDCGKKNMCHTAKMNGAIVEACTEKV